MTAQLLGEKIQQHITDILERDDLFAIRRKCNSYYERRAYGNVGSFLYILREGFCNDAT